MKVIDLKTSPGRGENRGSARDGRLIETDPTPQSVGFGSVDEASLNGPENRAAFLEGCVNIMFLPSEMPDSIGTAWALRRGDTEVECRIKLAISYNRFRSNPSKRYAV